MVWESTWEPKATQGQKNENTELILEPGTVNSPEHEHEKYWQGKVVVVVVRQEVSGDENCNIKDQPWSKEQ